MPTRRGEGASVRWWKNDGCRRERRGLLEIVWLNVKETARSSATCLSSCLTPHWINNRVKCAPSWFHSEVRNARANAGCFWCLYRWNLWNAFASVSKPTPGFGVIKKIRPWRGYLAESSRSDWEERKMPWKWIINTPCAVCAKMRFVRAQLSCVYGSRSGNVSSRCCYMCEYNYPLKLVI